MIKPVQNMKQTEERGCKVECMHVQVPGSGLVKGYHPKQQVGGETRQGGIQEHMRFSTHGPATGDVAGRI